MIIPREKKTLNTTLRIIKRISVRFAFHYRISHYRTMLGQCCNRTLLDTAVTYTFAEQGTYKASTVNDTRRNEQSLFAIYLIVPFDLHDNMHSPFLSPRSSLPFPSLPLFKKRNLCERAFLALRYRALFQPWSQNSYEKT